MTRLRANAHVTEREWDEFVASHPAGHILQTSPWARLKSEFGWSSTRMVVRQDDKIVGGAQILFRRLPVGTIAYVPKGPVIDLYDAASLGSLLDEVHRACRERGAIALKIEPDVAVDSARSGSRGEYWARLGFRPSEHAIQPRRTIVIDIRPPESEILARIKSKTRYNIRLAARRGVHVYEGTADDLPTFTRLMAITGERDEFGIRSPAYYERAYALFAPTGMAQLFVAEYREEPIAAIMVFACGAKAWYLYGASSNAHRERMPNYALQWAAIRWARVRGCTTYDLYGVPDHDLGILEANFATRSDGLWGVYRFKRGFGGQLVRTVGALDFVYRPALYWGYRMLVRLRGHRATE